MPGSFFGYFLPIVQIKEGIMTDSSPQTLAGRTALVTGASRGIGAAIARRLAHDGAAVVLHYGQGAAQVQMLAAELQAAGHVAHTVQANLADPDGAAKLLQGLPAGPIDILVNNAGIAPFVGTDQMSAEAFDELTNVNMRSVFLLTQGVLPRMPAGGRIVNLSSIVTRTTFPGLPAYAASKGFIDALTLHWAAEFAPRGILVNAVAPGAIDTRMSAWMHGEGGAQTLAQIQALPGMGQPSQVAGVVAFLAGPDGAWTTGQVIDASGGTKL
jgi:3-oxoacyl-[acyl-carrier protein] reductase